MTVLKHRTVQYVPTARLLLYEKKTVAPVKASDRGSFYVTNYLRLGRLIRGIDVLDNSSSR